MKNICIINDSTTETIERDGIKTHYTREGGTFCGVGFDLVILLCDCDIGWFNENILCRMTTGNENRIIRI